MSSSLLPNVPLFILLNQRSGSTDTDAARAVIEKVLKEADREYELALIEDPGRLNEIASRWVERACARGGAIVVGGGDGTIRTVAQATLGSGCPLGVLPQGTFNYFGRAYGIPNETAAAIRLLLTARVRPVQVGLVNERLFLVNASLGLHPHALEEREEDQASVRQVSAGRALVGGEDVAARTRANAHPTPVAWPNAPSRDPESVRRQQPDPIGADRVSRSGPARTGATRRHPPGACRLRADALADVAGGSGSTGRSARGHYLRLRAPARRPGAAQESTPPQGRHRR